MGANAFVDNETRDLLNTFDSLEKLLENENNSINNKNNTTMIKEDKQLILMPKYNIGDVVKVIFSDGSERIAVIDKVKTFTTKDETDIIYESDYLTTADYETDGFMNVDIYENPVSGTNLPFVKCKCKVIEI